MTRATLLAVAVALIAAAPAAAAADPFSPTIVNGDERGATIRFDVDGNAIDAHDGEIQRFGNRYHLYGTSYGCGYEWQRPGSRFCGFRSYSSTDLAHWRDDGPLFDATGPDWQGRCDGRTYGCYRPHVSFNPRTQRYVLWINSYDVPQGYHVFEAASPSGPFTEVAVPTLAVNGGIPPGVNNGDHDLFADEDGTAYLAYTDWRRGGDIVVEQLDERWMSGTGRFTRLGVTATEAPSLFRRGDRYYLTLSDPNCGYCTTGTSYLTADSPLGPWRGRPIPDSWRIENGALLVDGGGIGLSNAGADWRDYDVSMEATPLGTGGGGRYAQAGWVFRASSPGDGYAWLLGNYPHPGAEGGNLTKVVFRGGGIASAQVVKLPFAVESGRTYAIEMRLRGDRITTLVDGRVVDETRGERRLVDHPAAGGVDQHRVGPHPRQRRRPDQMAGTLGERDVQAHRVGAREQLVEGQGADAVRGPGGVVGREVGVVRRHLHAERPCPPRRLAGDGAEADQAEAAAADLAPDQPGARPRARQDLRRGVEGAAQEHHDPADHVLRDRGVVGTRGGKDLDAALAAGCEVDVVESDPEPADDHEPRGGREQLAAHLGPVAHDQRPAGAGEL
jgi:hypothetical protein